MSAFLKPRRLWQVICASPPHLSPIATFLSGASGQILSEPLRLIVWHFISLFLLCFPLYFVFCLFSLFFGFGFSCIFFFSVCFVCVLFLQFFRSSLRQFCRPPPTVGLYSTPLCDKLQTHLSVVEVCLNEIGFSLYFLFACI
jgi:hypothetical protein